jgi:hypothetical protein
MNVLMYLCLSVPLAISVCARVCVSLPPSLPPVPACHVILSMLQYNTTLMPRRLKASMGVYIRSRPDVVSFSCCLDAVFRQKQGRRVLYVTYLGVKHKVEPSKLEGRGQGAVLSRALDLNAKRLLQEHGLA